MWLDMTHEKEKQLIKKIRKEKKSSIFFFRFQTEFLRVVVVQNSGADRENLHLKVSSLWICGHIKLFNLEKLFHFKFVKSVERVEE